MNRTILRGVSIAALLFFVATVSFAQTTKSKIESMSGWSTCSTCAGAGGDGPSITHKMTQNISSPSMGGKSAEFYIAGKAAYGAAIWWKQLGADSSAHNFTYDLYFYLKNPSASQALEFDVNQSVDGKWLIFGTQCNIAAHTYDVYSVATHWVHTGIACSTPEAYKWNHLTLQFQRTSSNEVKFVSVTINGATHYINRTYAPKSTSGQQLNVAFQMDGNRSMTSYDAWLENVSLKYW